jgi:hypothetical protein
MGFKFAKMSVPACDANQFDRPRNPRKVIQLCGATEPHFRQFQRNNSTRQHQLLAPAEAVHLLRRRPNELCRLNSPTSHLIHRQLGFHVPYKMFNLTAWLTLDTICQCGLAVFNSSMS